jgi:hypothetical protein
VAACVDESVICLIPAKMNFNETKSALISDGIVIFERREKF